MLQETIANTKCEDNLIGTANARGVNNQFQAFHLDDHDRGHQSSWFRDAHICLSTPTKFGEILIRTGFPRHLENIDFFPGMEK